jgi:predicted hotdog family 3-hydroxylacyl-ACP dehydratase
MNYQYLMSGKEQMEQLIPQRTPMIMVDGLLSSDKQSTTSSLTVLQENIFVQNGFLQEPGLMENMAQTAALRAGYHAQLEGKEPSVGFIGSIKRLHIERLPKVNQQLITQIDLVNELMGAMIVHATTHVDGQIIAEADLSIFLSKTTNNSAT